MRLRPLTTNDKDWVMRIWNQHRSVFGPNGDVVWYRWVTDTNPRHRWLGYNEQAFVHYRLRQKDDVRIVYEIAVAQELQGKGLGRLVLRRIGSPISLKTGVENEAANRFYQALGFDHLGQSKSQDGSRSFNHYFLP